MVSGYLYIAVGERFRHEAERSARSLRRFTRLPICLITEAAVTKTSYFDQIMQADDLGKSFAVKVTGMQLSPFDKTVFLDTDTFVCDTIDGIFEMLDIFDMAMTLDQAGHSVGFWNEYQPQYEYKLKGVLHEFNTGVVGYVRNPSVDGLMRSWLEIHRSLNLKADMPTFREAFLKCPVRIGVLPHEYNLTGLQGMVIAHGKVRVIHERLGETWSNLRPHMASFNYMDRIAKRINRTEVKRLYVPYWGVIPYSYSPYYIKRSIKRMLGVKEKKKRDTLFLRGPD